MTLVSKKHQRFGLYFVTVGLTLLMVGRLISRRSLPSVVYKGSGIPGGVKVKTRETLKVGNFEPDPDETDASSIVKKLFKRADTTADGFLSMKELSWGIAVQVERHLQGRLTSCGKLKGSKVLQAETTVENAR